jgi:F0F1-type ATP synthase membrane subunit a
MMSAFLVTVANVLAGFEFVLSAAVRALGNAGAGHIQVNLGMGVPELHVGFVAGAVHAAMTVQIFGQEFN